MARACAFRRFRAPGKPPRPTSRPWTRRHSASSDTCGQQGGGGDSGDTGSGHVSSSAAWASRLCWQHFSGKGGCRDLLESALETEKRLLARKHSRFVGGLCGRMAFVVLLALLNISCGRSSPHATTSVASVLCGAVSAGGFWVLGSIWSVCVCCMLHITPLRKRPQLSAERVPAGMSHCL